jgi:hypothetical protein
MICHGPPIKEDAYHLKARRVNTSMYNVSSNLSAFRTGQLYSVSKTLAFNFFVYCGCATKNSGCDFCLKGFECSEVM